MRENFANDIDDETNLARHAFDKILPDKEHRLDSSYVARRVLEQQIMMFEVVSQRFFDDLVVATVLAFILKRPSPCAAILQFGQRDYFRHALGKRNRAAVVSAVPSG